MFNVSNYILWGPAVYFASSAIRRLIAPLGWQSTTKDYSTNEKCAEISKFSQQNIQIISSQNCPYVESLGTNFGQAALLVNEQLKSTDQEAYNYMCKYEFYHIRTNDRLVIPVFTALVSAIAAYTLRLNLSRISYGLPLLAAFITHSLALSLFEYKAERYALQHATSEELTGIKQFLECQIELNKELHGKHPRSFSSEGNLGMLFRSVSPSPLKYRLEEITAEMNRRNIKSEAISNEYSQKIKEFHSGVYKKFFKIET